MIVVSIRVLPFSPFAYILIAQHGPHKPDKEARRRNSKHHSQLLVGEVCETGPPITPKF